MTSEEFAKVYEEYSQDARSTVLWKFKGNQEMADDALQAASVYILERLERFKTITKSYFVQLVLNNARMIARADTRRYMRVLPQGLSADLEVTEKQLIKARSGRKHDPNSRYDEENTGFED